MVTQPIELPCNTYALIPFTTLNGALMVHLALPPKIWDTIFQAIKSGGTTTMFHCCLIGPLPLELLKALLVQSILMSSAGTMCIMSADKIDIELLHFCGKTTNLKKNFKFYTMRKQKKLESDLTVEGIVQYIGRIEKMI
jgi:hypothetical protein